MASVGALCLASVCGWIAVRWVEAGGARTAAAAAGFVSLAALVLAAGRTGNAAIAGLLAGALACWLLRVNLTARGAP